MDVETVCLLVVWKAVLKAAQKGEMKAVQTAGRLVGAKVVSKGGAMAEYSVGLMADQWGAVLAALLVVHWVARKDSSAVGEMAVLMVD